jgi:hypothetical protein
MRGSVHWAFLVRLDEQMALAQHFAHDAEPGKWPSTALLVIGSYMVSLVQVGCAISSLLTFSVSVSFLQFQYVRNIVACSAWVELL